MASGRGSYMPGTTVTAERGPVPIEQIEVGERVLSRDDSGDLTCREVTRVFRRAEAEQLALTFTDAHGSAQHLVTTPEHPFHLAGAGWVPAGELAIGAEFVTAEGGLARLTAVRPSLYGKNTARAPRLNHEWIALSPMSPLLVVPLLSTFAVPY